MFMVFGAEDGEGVDVVSAAGGSGGVGASFVAEDGNDTTVSLGFLDLKTG